MKTGLHWMMCPGPYNLVTFGGLPPALLEVINYVVIPKQVLIESPGLFLGDFRASIETGNNPRINERSELVRQSFQNDQYAMSIREIRPSFRSTTWKGRSRLTASLIVIERNSSKIPMEATGRHLSRLRTTTAPSFEAMDLDHVYRYPWWQ